MSYKIRLHLAARLLEALKSQGLPTQSTSAEKLCRYVTSRNATKSFDCESAQFCVSRRELSRVLALESDDCLTAIRDASIRAENKDILMRVDNDFFAKTIIKEVLEERSEYSQGFANHKYVKTKSGVIQREKVENVVVEFGSPNVAKPLHAGHLRSAIIGQFVANINQVVGNTVTRMSYLGDWGTQFGILAVGFRKFGNAKEFETNPIEHLFDVYVKTNQEVEKEGFEGEMYREAKDFMRLLERRKPQATALWRKFRGISIDWSSETFKRLGINFNKIEFESDYITKSQELCNELEMRNLLQYDGENAGFIQHDDTKIILKKSDGTSLYLSRDLAAILNRFTNNGFDKIHYVVDSGQSVHFQKMRKVLRLLNSPLAELENLHISFGRVRGMSTRRGNIVHLNSVLDEAKQRMLEIMTSKATTRTDNPDITAEILGLSAVFVQDLKEKRQKDYDFDWDRMLSNKGATGPFLQYGHARLCSLEATFPQYLEKGANFAVLHESEAIRLLQHLSKYDHVLNDCYSSLEPHTLVHYLLDLVTISNSAVKNLNVKNSPEEVACARMQLFQCTRFVLSNGIKILGLEPLREM